MLGTALILLAYCYQQVERSSICFTIEHSFYNVSCVCRDLLLSTEPYGELSTPYHVLRGLQALGTSSSENEDRVSSRFEYSSFFVTLLSSRYLSVLTSPYLFANLLHLSLLSPPPPPPPPPHRCFDTVQEERVCLRNIPHRDYVRPAISLLHLLHCC